MVLPILALVLFVALLGWVQWGCRPITRIIAGENLVDFLDPPRKKDKGGGPQSWDLFIFDLNRP